MDKKKEQLSTLELTRGRNWWMAMTAIATAIFLGLVALDIIRLLAVPLGILVFGICLAAAFSPLVSWLERRLPRLAAILVVYLVTVLVLGGLIWAIVPSLVQQVEDLAGRLPDLMARAEELIGRWRGSLPGNSVVNSLVSQLGSLGPTLLRLPLTVSSLVFTVLLILFISFYLLVEGSAMRKFVLSLFPEDRRPRLDELLESMVQAMGGYVRGVVLNGVIVGFITFVGLLLLGIDFALAFGVMAGLLELIPVAGPILAGLMIVVLTLLQSPGQALAALIFVVVLQQVENNILVPHIMRNQTNVSPLLTILALFAGGAIGGLMGALIAIPVAAAMRVVVKRVIAPAIRRQTGADPA